MEQALTQLAVKKLFDDSTGFDKMRSTIIYQNSRIHGYFMTWIRIGSEY